MLITEDQTLDVLLEGVLAHVAYAAAYAEAARLEPAAARGLARLEMKHLALAGALLLEWTRATGPQVGDDAGRAFMPLRYGETLGAGGTKEMV